MALNWSVCTLLQWCVNVAVHAPEGKSHSLTVWSALPDANRFECAQCQSKLMTASL